jgi:hypothetical protein
VFHDPLDRSPHCCGRTAALALLSRLGGAGESGGQCLEHSFDFRHALSGYNETLRRLDVTLGLATQMPFNVYCDQLLIYLVEFTAQHFREAFSLGTFSSRFGVGVIAG